MAESGKDVAMRVAASPYLNNPSDVNAAKEDIALLDQLNAEPAPEMPRKNTANFGEKS